MTSDNSSYFLSFRDTRQYLRTWSNTEGWSTGQIPTDFSYGLTLQYSTTLYVYDVVLPNSLNSLIAIAEKQFSRLYDFHYSLYERFTIETIIYKKKLLYIR